jgi:hypothetical protein
VKWCLVCCSVGQESPVVVQHARVTAELTGGFGRLALLKVSHSSFQRFRALDGHLITEEGDIGYSEDAVRRVDDDPALLNSSKRARRCC